MKVYWIENQRGEVLGNARRFTKTGVPKIYGSKKVASKVAKYNMAWRFRTQGGPFIIVEGDLNAR